MGACFMKNPQEVFAEFLVKERLKVTSQRNTILDVFLESKEHYSPEELYLKVKEKDPSVGQATVYRTLKLLIDSGIADVVDFADGVSRYELGYGKEHHDHLICEKCNKNIEILDAAIESAQEKVAKAHNFQLTRHKMYLYGICSDCSKK